jgi:hypothetical protein
MNKREFHFKITLASSCFLLALLWAVWCICVEQRGTKKSKEKIKKGKNIKKKWTGKPANPLYTRRVDPSAIA